MERTMCGPIRFASGSGSRVQALTSSAYLGLSGLMFGTSLGPFKQYSQCSGTGCAPHCSLNLNVPSPGVERPKSKTSQPLSRRVLNGRPIQEMVRAQRVVIANRRCPRHLETGPAAQGQPRGHRRRAKPHDVQAGTFRKRAENLAEQLAAVHGRAQIAHVPRKDRVELIEQLDVAALDGSPDFSAFLI